MKMPSIEKLPRPIMALLAGIIASAGMARATVINVANPNNFLVGATVTVASPGISGGPFGSPPNQYTFTGNSETIVDNLAAGENQDDDFIFADGGQNDRFSVTNFGTRSGATDLRFFIAPEDGQRVPTEVTVYSSTASQTSTLVSDYSLLGARAVSGPYTPYDPSEPTGNGRGYFDLSVSLPAETQSLLVDFTGSQTGARIYEFQALPEPASCMLLALGVGMAAIRRRRHTL